MDDSWRVFFYIGMLYRRFTRLDGQHLYRALPNLKDTHHLTASNFGLQTKAIVAPPVDTIVAPIWFIQMRKRLLQYHCNGYSK